MRVSAKSLAAALMLLTIPTGVAFAQERNGGPCPVAGNSALQAKLKQAVQADTTGLNNHYWAVVVNEGGVVCAVAYSGESREDQWLLSRQIAAAKAFTANGLSLDSAPLSTGQLYYFVQPSHPGFSPVNPLYGLNGGNVLDSDEAYAGSYDTFGTDEDPMIGKRVGGTITFGGGLGLYNGTRRIGGLGLSGDTACADHSVAWRLRNLLGRKPTAGDDRIALTQDPTVFGGHPHCPNDANTQGKK